MASVGNIAIKWDRDPIKVLSELRRGLRNKICRPAIASMTKEIAKDVKRAAPKDRGALRVSIGRKVYTAKTGSRNVLGLVGAKSKFQRMVKKRGKIVRYTKSKRADAQGSRNGRAIVQIPALYQHLVEKGHHWPRKRKGGARLKRLGLIGKAVRAVKVFVGLSGKVKPHPFLAPTLRRGWVGYSQTMSRGFKAGFDKYLK